jgi:hypothetical protein
MSGENWQSCVNAAAKHFFGENLSTDEQFADKEEAMTNLAAILREQAFASVPQKVHKGRSLAPLITLKFSLINFLPCMDGFTTY